MSTYKKIVRPALFRLPADRAHDLAQGALRWSLPWKVIGRRTRLGDPGLVTDLAGLRLENPVGLAPGFDKNGRLIGSLDQLGFGYLVIGSITAAPRAGNPKPRLVRYPERQSLGNNMGLPSLGLRRVVEILRRAPKTRAKLLASVTGFSADELVEAAAAVEPHVDAVELGLVCPNTAESQRMAELEIFTEVAERLSQQRSKPVFVRLPPHHDDHEWQRARSILDVCLAVGIEGVSTNGRIRVADPRLPNGEGSIAGKATFDEALRVVRDVASHAAGRLAIRASGGVFSGEDAATMLTAGATTVEMYTSFIYRGPRTAELVNRELVEILERDGLSDVAALRAPTRAAHREGTEGACA